MAQYRKIAPKNGLYYRTISPERVYSATQLRMENCLLDHAIT